VSRVSAMQTRPTRLNSQGRSRLRCSSTRSAKIITAINAQGTPVVLLEQNAGRAAPRRCLPVMAMAAEVSRMAEECMRFATESDVATRPNLEHDGELGNPQRHEKPVVEPDLTALEATRAR